MTKFRNLQNKLLVTIRVFGITPDYSRTTSVLEQIILHAYRYLQWNKKKLTKHSGE